MALSLILNDSLKNLIYLWFNHCIYSRKERGGGVIFV